MEERYNKQMKQVTGKAIFSLFTLLYLISICCFSNCTSSFKDDRLVSVPCQDSILEEMIQKCKAFTYSRGINPEIDTTMYYVTFIFGSINDSVIVQAMGSFSDPFIFHDKSFQYCRFQGYFLRKNTYCFFYESRNNKNHISAVDQLIEGWRKRDPSENEDFFPDDIGNQDPVSFEYYVDSVGKYHYLRRVRW